MNTGSVTTATTLTVASPAMVAMKPAPHLGTVDVDVTPSADGYEDCLAIGARWVHLRTCQACGHVGCCDSSPNRHATAHHRTAGDPVVRSFEPGEDWFFCYPDELTFELDGVGPGPSHP